MKEDNFTKDKKTLRTAIYLRLSNEDRDKCNKDDVSESIKNQRNMLIDYIDKNDDFILVDEYCDEDLSGAGTYRPEFERLIRDCESGKIDIVLCKSQSRFSRDMEIVEKYINNKFNEWNIRFIGLADSADTLNSGNKKSRQINGLVNEWYLEDVSNNIRSAFNSKMKQGEFISPFTVYGYEVSSNDNNKIVVDSIASEVVKEIFNLYLKGFGFTKIAKYLNEKNIPCPSLYKYRKGIKLNVVSKRPREEIKWSANAIKSILTNEIYLGNLVQGKRSTISYKNKKIINKPQCEWIRKENTHEAIIDKEVFNKVQSAIKERTKPLKYTGNVHIFSGKVFCLECKRCMRKKNSARHEYLVCSSNSDGYDSCINKSSIRYDGLEELVLDAINKKIKEFGNYDFIEREIMNKEKSGFNKKIDLLKQEKDIIIKRISKSRFYLKRLYEDKVNGVITIEQFNYLFKDYKNDESRSKKRLKTIDCEVNYYQKNTVLNIEKFLSKYKKLDKLNKVIVDEFINKIYIGKLNKETNIRVIQIIWNF